MVVMITISRVPHLVWAQSTSQTTLGYKQQQHQQQYTKTLNKSAVANDKTKVRLMGEGSCWLVVVKVRLKGEGVG